MYGSARALPEFGVGLLLVALLISGCTGMSQKECAVADWRTVGYEDGVNGYSGGRIGHYRTACAKYAVTPDLASYQAGREQGLREFCRPANGYRIGTAGGGYGGVCPADLEPAFLSAFNAGHELYTLQARVWNADAQLDAKRRELAGLEQGIAAASTAVVSDNTTGGQRAQALVDAAQMAEQVGRLRQEIHQLEADRVSYERDLDDYRSRIPPIG
jgi:Protein of unknown function (DUF2799)